MKYPIHYKVTPITKVFDINEEENRIFDLLYSKLPEKVNNRITLIRLSDGTLLVECVGYYIGRINLQGKNKFMQILTSLYDNSIIHENFDENVDVWVKYINNHILKEL